MFVGAPIKDESEKIIAALAFRLDPHIELSPILQQGRIGDSGETYAFIKEGEMITQSRFEQSLEKHGVTVVDTTGIIHLEVRNPGVNLTQGKQANISRKQQPFTRMAKSAMTGESGQDLEGYRDYRGVPVIGSWLWSERLGFGMTTEIDVVEAYSMLNFNRRIIFISAFILGLLTLGFFAFLIKYLNQSRKSARILIENEQTMRLLLNSTGEAIYGIDLNGECTFANKTCLNLLGYQSEDKLLSKNMHDVIHHTRKDGRLYPVEECKII
ncbi:MAG: PAS domain-containing protein, partial [Methylomarinum sp.]|nr:PAS domain-containing protein [Methylomarinum sp.]